MKFLETLKIKNDSPKALLVHLGIMLLIVVILIILFFYVYLPINTHHGESITVPNVVGMKVDELEDFLSSRDLKYEVSDSVYTTKFPAFAVVKQYPDEGFQVKEGRKISITLNRKTPELVKMPQLVGTSFKNAQMIAQSNGLNLKITYVPHKYQNLVLKQMVGGKEVTEGSPVYQGTEVLIEVGDPSLSEAFPVPNYIGQEIDNVEIAIKGQGLELEINYDDKSTEPEGTVIKQRPESGDGKTIKAGESVTVWVSQPASDSNSSPADQNK